MVDSTEFSYDSERWKRLREQALRRDGYHCRNCRRYGRVKSAVEVHHIIHVKDDPSRGYDLDNLISLCDSCHRKRHPERAKKGARSRRRGNPYEP